MRLVKDNFTSMIIFQEFCESDINVALFKLGPMKNYIM